MKYILEYGFYLSILIVTVFITSKSLGIKPQKHKYAALDGLRGICAAMVAVFHLYWRAGGESDFYWSLDYITISNVKRAIYLTGELSVGVFFMLSAFLFFRKALAESFNVKDFAISRFMRIYPPVIATLFIIYITTFIMNVGGHTPVWEWFISSLPFIFKAPEQISMVCLSKLPRLVFLDIGVGITLVLCDTTYISNYEKNKV